MIQEEANGASKTMAAMFRQTKRELAGLTGAGGDSVQRMVAVAAAGDESGGAARTNTRAAHPLGFHLTPFGRNGIWPKGAAPVGAYWSGARQPGEGQTRPGQGGLLLER